MSDKQEYNVDVEIIHVDMAESYLCGYLRIQGSLSLLGIHECVWKHTLTSLPR